MKTFWNTFFIAVCLIVLVTFSRSADAYEFQYLNTEAQPKYPQAVRMLSDQMKFGDTNMAPPKLQKAKRELASCEIDMMAQDQQEYDLTADDFNSMYNGVVNYYRLHNTPFFSRIAQEDIEYAYELEHRCAKYHPQQEQRITPRVAMYEAEKMVDNQCNWDSVSTPDEYEAARECRIKIHEEVYNKYNLDY